MKKQKHIRNLINKAVDIVFWSCMVTVLWFTLQVFLFSSFKIPSDSMEPELTIGDNILVLKPTIGPRVFNLFASMRTNKQRFNVFQGSKRFNEMIFSYLTSHIQTVGIKSKCIFSNITSSDV